MKGFSEMAGDKRLNKYGGFGLIDSLVRTYAGTYTHDEILEMEVLMVHTMLKWNKELAYITQKTSEIQRQVNESKKK